MGQPPRMCAVPGTSNRISVTMLIGVPPTSCGHLAGKIVSLRDEGGDARGRGSSASCRNGQNHGRPSRISMWPSSVCMQSRMKDSRAKPNGCRQRTVRMGWRSREHASVLEPEQDARAPGRPAGQDGGQQPHGVRPRRVARGLDMGVLVEVEARTDGDALRKSSGCRARARRSAIRHWCARGCRVDR